MKTLELIAYAIVFVAIGLFALLNRLRAKYSHTEHRKKKKFFIPMSAMQDLSCFRQGCLELKQVHDASFHDDDTPFQFLPIVNISKLKPKETVIFQLNEDDKWVAAQELVADENGEIKSNKNVILDLLVEMESTKSQQHLKNLYSVENRKLLVSVHGSEFKVLDYKYLDLSTIIQDKIETKQVSQEDFSGNLYVPTFLQKGNPKVGIIIVPDRDGQTRFSSAALFAQNGFVSFALNLPTKVVEYPVETICKVIDYMDQQVNLLSRVILMGQGNGCELCLLAASLYPNKFRGIILQSPSFHVNSAWSSEKEDSRKSAWSHLGQPIIPFIPSLSKITEPSLQAKLFQLLKIPVPNYFKDWIRLFESMDSTLLEKSRIKVEKLDCPILIQYGTDDHVLPSSYFVQQLQKLLQQKQFVYTVQSVEYEKLGHYIPESFMIPRIAFSILKNSHNSIHFYNGGGDMETKEYVKVCQTSLKMICDFIKKECIKIHVQ